MQTYSRKSRSCDFAVIGGGMCGMYMCMRLIDSGVLGDGIVLIESTRHLGGRVHQKTFEDVPSSNSNLSFPAGAGRFHMGHSRVVHAMRRFKMTPETCPLSCAQTRFIDVHNKFTHKLKRNTPFHYIDRVLDVAHSEDPDTLRQYTFSEYASMLLLKDELEYVLIAAGYSGQLRYMNMLDALRLFKTDIRQDIQYCTKGLLEQLRIDLINHLRAKGVRILMHTRVQNVQRRNTLHVECITENTRTCTLTVGNVIFALPQYALLKIPTLKPIHSLLRNSVTCKPLCRVYAQFDPQTPWLDTLFDYGKCVVDNHLRMVIPINRQEGLVMISYSDDRHTRFWERLAQAPNADTKLKNAIKRLIRAAFHEDACPLRVTVCAWKCGVAYWNKHVDSSHVAKHISHPLPRIYICNENYSLRQSWVEGAFESVERTLESVTKKPIKKHLSRKVSKTRLPNLEQMHHKRSHHII